MQTYITDKNTGIWGISTWIFFFLETVYQFKFEMIKFQTAVSFFYLKYFLTSSSMCELITYKLMYSASQNVKQNVKIARILGYLLL